MLKVINQHYLAFLVIMSNTFYFFMKQELPQVSFANFVHFHSEN